MVTGRIKYEEMTYKIKRNNLDHYVKIVNTKMDNLEIELTDEGIKYKLKGILINTEHIHKLCNTCPHNRVCERGTIKNYDGMCWDSKYIPGLIVANIRDHLEYRANLCDIEDIIGLVENPEEFTMPIFWYNSQGDCIELHNAQHTDTCKYIKLDENNHIID